MQYKRIFSLLISAMTALSLSGCTPPTNDNKPVDKAVNWVQTSAEYEALALQAYGAASEDLDRFIADTSWSALPNQVNASDLPPAIIADIDETVVSNVAFQASFQPPFSDRKLHDWNKANTAEPTPGVIEFLHQAEEAGVTVFFLTNRPCQEIAGDESPCPQKAVTVQDLRESGISVATEKVSLSRERPEWGKEKLIRRTQIAKTHRVIMLFGDDLGDFIACSRAKQLHPCDDGATIDSRHKATVKFSKYWGEGWYILPNPMHGSWTSVN